MSFPIVVLVASFLILLVVNVPVAFCMGIAAMLSILAMGDLPTFVAVAHKIATGIDSFSLLAIPFFIFSGLLMGHGGIARRLIDFANVMVGRFRGGLAFVNILTCMLFGAISGSAAAAVSSVGGFMIPLMNKRGYDKNFNTAVTVTAATTGLLIPPSNVMIVYSLATGGIVSIAAIFMAGVIPGILVGLGLMLVAGVISIKNHYGEGEKATVMQAVKSFFSAVPALLLIVIVLGGILLGVFTATEASAVAVLYAFILAVFCYKEVKVNEIPKILLQCGVTTSVVFLLIGTSMAMSWVLAAENVPQDISAALLSLTDNRFVLLLMINVILLAVGTFMDMTPAVLIFTPIFLPIVTGLGVDPVHFGIIMIMNLCIGLCTPPVGTCLFLGCGIGETTVTKVIPKIIWFFVAMIAVLLICSYIPNLSLWLPDALGLLK
ncbi:MAG: TRAP transporter large permease [Phycisphaerae bacterium]|nr:TRAP transporter large permease [Phycisphaerae bacterium]